MQQKWEWSLLYSFCANKTVNKYVTHLSKGNSKPSYFAKHCSLISTRHVTIIPLAIKKNQYCTLQRKKQEKIKSMTSINREDRNDYGS